MKIIKNLTTTKIIILSIIACLFLVVIIFLCSVRAQEFEFSEEIADASYNKIIINADCDVNFFSMEKDINFSSEEKTTVALTGMSKQFFKAPQYALSTRIEDKSLIIDVVNNAGYFLKDIRYEIELSLALPKFSYDIVLNSKQGIFTFDEVKIASFYAENLKGKICAYSSTFETLKLDGYSGVLQMESNSVHDLDVKMSTGKIILSGFRTASVNIEINDGTVLCEGFSACEDSLDVNISARKGTCKIFIDSLPFLNLIINTKEADVQVIIFSAMEVNCVLSSNKGKVENNLTELETSDIKIEISSEKGNIVLSDKIGDVNLW